MSYYPYGYLILFLLIACSGKKKEQASRENVHMIHYQLNDPSEIYELPDDLEEISGLAAISGTHLLCNEDETGTLYFFNLAKGEVEDKLKWGKKGDYEGVAVHQGNAYVLKSKGSIYRLENYLTPYPEVVKMKTGIGPDCDAEGLCSLPNRNSLLIACKEGDADTRNVYELDLEEGVLRHEPYLKMNLSEIEDFLVSTGLDKVSVQLRKMLDPQGSSGVMFPSGIAVHPQTEDLYILSSRSKLLVIYDAEGQFKEAIELDHQLFKQAEAITFTPNGDIYVGNEGKGGKATILKFVYDPQ